MSISQKLLVGAVLLLGSGLPSVAMPIPSDTCGVVIASELTVETLLERRLLAGLEQPYWVVQSPNGAYAAILGLTQKTASDAVVKRLKDEQGIPSDSFCLPAEKMTFLPQLSSSQPFEVFAAEARSASSSVQQVATSLSQAQDVNPRSDVRIGGLDWSMRTQEMIRVLEGQGVQCGLDPKKPTQLKCDGERGEVWIKPGELMFGCRFTSTCGGSTKSIAQSLLNQFRIFEMTVVNSPFGPLGYCGESQGGNQVCVLNIVRQIVISVRPFGISALLNRR